MKINKLTFLFLLSLVFMLGGQSVLQAQQLIKEQTKQQANDQIKANANAKAKANTQVNDQLKGNVQIKGQTKEGSVQTKDGSKEQTIEGSTQVKEVPTKASATTKQQTKDQSKEKLVSVILKSMELQKSSEKSGDEVYIDITQYSNMGGSKVLRVPEKPLHWKSKDLSQIKDLTLWQGKVQNSEEFKIIFSIVEQDNPPWDVDDLIGSALLELENTNGKIKHHWELPVFEDRVDQKMLPGENPKRFIMKGDNSSYVVDFVLKTGN